jgi:type IV fimbrial biogenesis protein FimT
MHGQTLVELMVCLLIGGLMLTIAVPAFTSTLQRNQRTQAVNQLLGALHFARSSAVTGRTTMALCSGSATCDSEKIWRSQLLVFDDRNDNGKLDVDERLQQQFTLRDGYSWRW